MSDTKRNQTASCRLLFRIKVTVTLMDCRDFFGKLHRAQEPMFLEPFNELNGLRSRMSRPPEAEANTRI